MFCIEYCDNLFVNFGCYLVSSLHGLKFKVVVFFTILLCNYMLVSWILSAELKKLKLVSIILELLRSNESADFFPYLYSLFTILFVEMFPSYHYFFCGFKCFCRIVLILFFGATWIMLFEGLKLVYLLCNALL